MDSEDTLLIGADGGATEVKAHAVRCDDLARPTTFELRVESAARVYPPAEGFTPTPVTEQLAQRDGGRIELSTAESERGRLLVGAAVEAIVDLAQQCAARRVLVGIGMPGLKTPDGRGINVINNGPRIPQYLETLERSLAGVGLELASPVAALGSDADYCGLGEEYAAEGLFRDVESSYYVGCGTGIADAMKLRGELVPFDQAKSWMQKSWQIPSALGPTFEKLVSAKSLNQVYANLTEATKRAVAAGASPAGDAAHTADTAVPPGDTARRAVAHRQEFPEKAGAAGQPIAIAWMHAVALVLAELIFERLWTIKNGRAHTPHRGAAYARLNPQHTYRGLVLDRIVIGQRIGMIYADAAFRAVFGDRLDAYLAALVGYAGDTEMASAYLSPKRDQLKPGFIQASKLRAAPALGAAVAAVQARSGSQR